MRVAPYHTLSYVNLTYYSLALQRFDEARQFIHEAQVQKRDYFELHDFVYALAFLGAETSAMAEQQQWYAGHSEYESRGLAFASDTEAYGGHLGKARELTERAVDSAIRADSKENAAIWQENAAIEKPLTAILQNRGRQRQRL